MRINKYILQIIFSYIKSKTKLKIIKFNKKLMSKLDITLYIYQKHYFYSIVTETLLENKNFLKKKFDEKTLDKLISEFENDKTGIYENENEIIFEKMTDLKIYYDLIETDKISNLTELILDNINSMKLPCDNLINLEKLYLCDVKNIKFISEHSNISLNKLKYIYLDNVIFENDQNIKVTMNDLIYLDLRIYYMEDNEYYQSFENLGYLINIFNFDFLAIYSKEIFYDEKQYNIKKFKGFPKKIFNNTIINKLNYFNFEIKKEFIREGSEGYTHKYIFSKSKSNKYIFETYFKTESYDDFMGRVYELIQQEYRLCNNRNYNKYYFIDKDMIINKGMCDEHDDYLFKGNFSDKDLNVNSFRILDNDLDHDEYEMYFLSLLNQFKVNNNLEILEFDYLDIYKQLNFIENLSKCKKLRVFRVNKNFLLNENKLVKILKCLSECKYLLLINISFEIEDERRPKFNKNLKNEIYKLFPDMIFIKDDKKISMKWKNKKSLIK